MYFFMTLNLRVRHSTRWRRQVVANGSALIRKKELICPTMVAQNVSILRTKNTMSRTVHAYLPLCNCVLYSSSLCDVHFQFVFCAIVFCAVQTCVMCICSLCSVQLCSVLFKLVWCAFAVCVLCNCVLCCSSLCDVHLQFVFCAIVFCAVQACVMCIRSLCSVQLCSVPCAIVAGVMCHRDMFLLCSWWFVLVVFYMFALA